ncbi:MAG: ATP-binding cassette domain-containing protein [Candidatus Latescibacter sp.]|nr:ATP-binding cassette domain-containing protein [Candidatus Latescibacter sp.]
MIRIENLTKYYGDFRVVDNISFTVNDGEILGFLGPNGAGKTTTLRMLTCFMPPSEGRIMFNDLDVNEHSMEIRRMIGYLPENAPLYDYMSIQEYLDYICDLRDITGQKRNERMEAMIETCGLSKMIGKDIGELSKGYRQRVGIAQAMIHEPEILILDEPTVGLDPNQIVEIRNLIKEVGQKKTVILSTHILSEVESTCNRVVIISSGEIVADGTTDSLQEKMAGQNSLTLEIKGNAAAMADVYSQIKGVEKIHSVTSSGGNTACLEIGIHRGFDIRDEVFRATVEKGWVIYEMRLNKTNLEEVFRQLTLTQGAVAQ